MARLNEHTEALGAYEQCLKLCIDAPTRELVEMRVRAVRLDQRDAESGIYFRHLVPGEGYCCGRSLNPITKVIFEIAVQMRNICYLIGDRRTGQCYVIDPCWDVDGILKQVRKDGMRVTGVLQTHNHFDHTGGLPPPPFDTYHVKVPGVKKMLERCGTKDAKVYVHKLDADIFQEETGIDPRHIECTEDGQELMLGQVTIRVMHTPGHTPGSQCLRVNETRVFTGDTLFVGSCGRVDLPGGDPEAMFDSLQNRLAALPDETLLFPAHLYSRVIMTTVGHEKRHGQLAPRSYEDWVRQLGAA